MADVRVGGSWFRLLIVAALVCAFLVLALVPAGKIISRGAKVAPIDFTLDDSYITYRYSANWAEGHGPVWNVGHDPVEGYTSFFWVVVNAASDRCMERRSVKSRTARRT